MKKLMQKIQMSLAVLILTLAQANLSGAGLESMSDKGIDLGVSATNIYQRNVKGGLSSSNRKGEYSGKYDIEAEFDFDKLFGLDGTFFVHIEGGWTSSEGIDPHSVGSYLGVNANAIGNRSGDVVEAFYSIEPVEGFSLSLGKLDLTGFFDTNMYANDEAEQFINNGLVNNPSIPFPDYGLGVVASLNLTDSWYIAGSAADAQADGRTTGFSSTFTGEDYFFFIAETGLYTSLQGKNGELVGSYRLGLWNDPQPKSNSVSGSEYRDDFGVYLSFDQMIYQPESKQQGQGLGAFARLGFCDGKRNDLTKFYSFGLQYKGLFESREEDTLGIGYANGGFTSRVASIYPQRREQIVEMFYNCKLSENVSLAPDVQYISKPGAAGERDSVAVGLRLHISL